MADISADSLLPGGEFKATLCSGTLSIASGASGTLATLTSTGGRKIRLTMLSVANGGSEAGISVVADGVTVISALKLDAGLHTAGNFTIGYGVSGGAAMQGNINHIEAFNTITITKASGSTANTIYYSTEQGF